MDRLAVPEFEHLKASLNAHPDFKNLRKIFYKQDKKADWTAKEVDRVKDQVSRYISEGIEEREEGEEEEIEELGERRRESQRIEGVVGRVRAEKKVCTGLNEDEKEIMANIKNVQRLPGQAEAGADDEVESEDEKESEDEEESEEGSERGSGKGKNGSGNDEEKGKKVVRENESSEDEGRDSGSEEFDVDAEELEDE